MTEKQIYESMPPNQQEALRHLALGFTTKTSAFKLRISPKIVEYHRRQVYKILCLQGGDRDPAIMATRFAIRVGAVSV